MTGLLPRLVNAGQATSPHVHRARWPPARDGRTHLFRTGELGSVEPDRHGAELLFQVPTELKAKDNVAIASHESFGGLTRAFTDPAPARPSSAASPSTAPSSGPAPTPTGSPAPGPGLGLGPDGFKPADETCP
ncbi:MAG TPA: hypothetical protein VE546_26715, partial [Streptomyces sp.]|nr:hypothetical protein [Streptomyces sp.]